ncbi:MAG: hypothetical protein IPI67_02515 [Myxococcales bacterium]|nr:hypothetical protein [Myxococcales bacterium]
MPTDVDIDDRDESGTDAPAIIRRLTKVLKIQAKVTARLTLIGPHTPNPGPPELPTALNAIIAEANASIDLARNMLGSR